MTVLTIPYNFTPYPYQEALYNCLTDGYRRGFAVMHRRAGKDKVFMNILARESVKRIGTYFYILPYYKQARLIIWEGIDGDGFRFRDHIPPQLVKRKENQQMVLELTNGSIVRFLGSDNIDAIVGTNPLGVLFSEYSLHKPQAWNYLRPILAQNDGWALFNGTPRGKNHAYDLFQLAKKDDNWFTIFQTVDDTLKQDGSRVVTEQAVENERQAGMPPELIEQEFYCSFQAGMVGSYYTDLMKILDKSDPPQITSVSYDPQLPVGCAWDLGINDENSIWFFQQHRQEIRLIDFYSNSGKGLPHYVNYINSTGYHVSTHFLPFDVNVREYVSGRKRIDTFRSLNLKGLEVMPKISIQEGVNAVRQILPRCWFDEVKCADGIECLRNYRREFDEKNNVFRKNPAHDQFSHGADAFRMLALGVRNPKTKTEQDVLKHTHAIGYDHDPFVRDGDRSTIFEKHMYTQKYTNPNNYDPFTRRVH